MPVLAIDTDNKVLQSAESVEETRRELDEIGSRLGIQKGDLEGWYNVSPAQFLRHGGFKFRGKDKFWIQRYLKRAYPDHSWDMSKFTATSNQRFWSIRENQRAALLYLGEQLGIKEGDYDAWYKVTPMKLSSIGGKKLLNEYNVNRIALLSAVFPEHKWDPNLFYPRPANYWMNTDNHRKELLALGEKLGIKEGDYEAWYKVPTAALRPLGLSRKLSTGTSRYAFFSSVFPQFSWKPWLFVNAPIENVFNLSDDDLQVLCDYAERHLGITSPSGWYEVTKEDLMEVGLHRFFPHQAHLIRMLQVSYPNEIWNITRFKRTAEGFGLLLSKLVLLFGNAPSIGSEHFHDIGPEWDKSVFEKTIALPRYRVLFHYQGPQFYAKQIIQNQSELILEVDPLLSKWTEESRWSLISVPFWAAHATESALLADLFLHRPDLFDLDGVLAHRKGKLEGAQGIPKKIPAPNINKHYLRLWAKDRRFQDLFFKDK